MPLYEYRCRDCELQFDVLRPMADRNRPAVCPSCESTSSLPLISLTSPSPSSVGAIVESSGRAEGGGGGCCGGGCGCN